MKGDHRFQDIMATPLNLYPVGQKGAQTGGLPNSEVVSEVRGLWLRTTPLTCDVCVDSGWWASELNCGTADKNYKRWVLKRDWRETKADTGRRVRRPLQLRMVALEQRGCDGDTKEWFYSSRLLMLLYLLEGWSWDFLVAVWCLMLLLGSVVFDLLLLTLRLCLIPSPPL